MRKLSPQFLRDRNIVLKLDLNLINQSHCFTFEMDLGSLREAVVIVLCAMGIMQKQRDYKQVLYLIYSDWLQIQENHDGRQHCATNRLSCSPVYSSSHSSGG